MGEEEEEEVIIRRNKPRKKDPIVQQPPPPPPSTISSLISTNDNQKKIKKKIKKYLTISSSSFRGLGCTTGHPQEQVVSVPAAIIIRTSANWHDPPPPLPPPKHNNNNNNKVITNNNNNKVITTTNNNNNRKLKMKNCMSSSGGSDEVDDDDDDDVGVLGCLAVPDVNVFCGPPSIGFSTDAVPSSSSSSSSSSVDSVVSRRTTATTNNTEVIRQRGSYGGRRMVHPEDLPFFDTDSEIPHPHRSFGARHHRHLRHLHHYHRSHEGLAEIARLQGNLLMRGRSEDDQYRDWRLDVDSMSYEELLALGDKIGYVCTGLKEDEIRRCVRKTNPTVVPEDKPLSRIQTETHSKCTICQEEFEGDDEIGKLDCGHFYHMICIKQWLGKKKTCPICKVEVNPQQ